MTVLEKLIIAAIVAVVLIGAVLLVHGYRDCWWQLPSLPEWPSSGSPTLAEED